MFYPWQLLFGILAGAVNREQQHAIEYLSAENQVFKEKLGKQRIKLNHDQRPALRYKARFWVARRYSA